MEKGIQRNQGDGESRTSSDPKWKSVIAIDLETIGPNALDTQDPTTRISHASWWNGNGVGNVIRINRRTKSQEIYALQSWLADPKKIKVFWNFKYDGKLLQRDGYVIKGPVYDAMLLSYLNKRAEKQHTLKHFARKFLGADYREEDKLKAWLKKHPDKSYGEAPEHLITPYALVDAQYTWELFYLMYNQLSEAGRRILKQEMKVLFAVMEMENRGVKIDLDLCAILSAKCQQVLQATREDISKKAGKSINPNSSQQLVSLIYDGHRLDPVRRTKKGAPAVDKLALIQLKEKIDICEDVLKYRRFYKAQNTYLKAFAEKSKNGILRGSFNQMAARTGRFSASEPNLQNITRSSNEMSDVAGHLRKCFIARDNYTFLFADFDQVELRLAACFANIDPMLEAIRNGDNLHGLTTKRMFHIDEDHPDWKKHYHIGKTLNFAIFYGCGARKLRDILAMGANVWLSPYECSQFLEKYHHAYPQVHAYFDKINREVAQTGGVTNAYGRFVEVNLSEPYKGVNYAIQGSAADLIKEKIVKCQRLLDDKLSGMVMTVHDEIAFEIHRNEKSLIPKLVEAMQEEHKFQVPITCSAAIGKRWGTKKDITDLEVYR